MLFVMSDVTQILQQIEHGNSVAANELLPLVYDELRELAAARMAAERSDHTLQATALVHEAYVKLVDVDRARHWDSRGHFFAAAAEAMRRLLVDHAHRKNSLKRGGDRQRIGLDDANLSIDAPEGDILALDEALAALANQEPRTAELVKLRYFAGFTNQEACELLGIAPRTGDALWSFARVWLHERIVGETVG